MSDTIRKDHWYLGLFMHSSCMGKLQVLDNTLIRVNADGTIVSVTPPEHGHYKAELARARQSNALTVFGTQHLIIPGLIDLHVHAPQWPQLGKALHLPLQDWLQKHTFPLEARYNDIDYAETVYRSLVSALLSNGTTTAMYFATIHEEATTVLASTCLSLGQRAYVGRVAMDDIAQCPDYYRDANAKAALMASERSIRHIRQLAGNQSALVKPVLTPRFIPSCSDELLTGLGELAARYDCHIQTHCSESDWEHAYVIDRLNKTDSQALADFGLLTRHTVLAHANFISDDDMQLICDHESGIAHCPLSNSYFANSVFPLRAALNKSLNVGLGTDIAGGHSASMFTSCQHAISSSRMLETGVDPQKTESTRGKPGARINYIDAFYLATAGGAKVLDCPVGLFEPGRQFDALQLDLAHPGNPLNEFTEASCREDLLACVIYNTQPCNVKSVWVAGQKVHTN